MHKAIQGEKLTEQDRGADGGQRPRRSRFRARLTAGVRLIFFLGALPSLQQTRRGNDHDHRPARRIGELKRFIEHVKQLDEVWSVTRQAIAALWAVHYSLGGVRND